MVQFEEGLIDELGDRVFDIIVYVGVDKEMSS